MDEIPQAVPWILTALSGLGNLAQMLAGLRRGRVDVDKIRQDMTLELIEKARELNGQWEVRNGNYIARLAAEKEEMIAVNQQLQSEVGQLRRRVMVLESLNKAQASRIRSVEDELRAWQG